jgi:hypothetical protein
LLLDKPGGRRPTGGEELAQVVWDRPFSDVHQSPQNKLQPGNCRRADLIEAMPQKTANQADNAEHRRMMKVMEGLSQIWYQIAQLRMCDANSPVCFSSRSRCPVLYEHFEMLVATLQVPRYPESLSNFHSFFTFWER